MTHFPASVRGAVCNVRTSNYPGEVGALRVVISSAVLAGTTGDGGVHGVIVCPEPSSFTADSQGGAISASSGVAAVVVVFFLFFTFLSFFLKGLFLRSQHCATLPT